jgi:hypothetical protein
MTPHEAYYESKKIGKSFELENILVKSAEYSYYYALHTLEKRFLLGEQSISEDSRFSYYYARDVIKSRFALGEKSIIKDSGWIYFYSKDVIKGKLPLIMHNAMIFYADTYSRRYFEYLKSLCLPKFL